MMENEEDNDFIGGTGDDDDTAPPMENEVNNDFIGIGGTGNDDDTAPRPLGGMKANSNVWGKLRSDLTASSKKHGCQLTSNGSHGKANQVSLRCSRFRFYPESKRRLKDDCVYRQHTINCDKANARKATGNALPRKTSTSRPVKVKEESTCKVKLVIGVDATSFF
jgi:hypothetical protein